MTTPDRTIPRETVAQMIHRIDPDWAVREAELTASGQMPVYRLTIEAAGDTTEYILKASPDENRYGIDIEARLLRILRAHTSIPVPGVIGAVDTHDELPTPFFLMESVSGRNVPRKELNELSEQTIGRIATSTGKYLAELHRLNAVDTFGFLERDPTQTLNGGRPSASIDQIRVADPEKSWPTRVRGWADETLEQHSHSRFSDVTADIRPVVYEHIEQLSGPFEPVLGHIDNSIENVFFEPETGDVTALCDWAFTLAATPAYDLACVEWSLSGGHWAMVPSAPDFQRTVREGLVEGYRENAPARVIEQFRDHHALYELLSVLRAMIHFDDWFEMKNVSQKRTEGAADGLRETVSKFT